jgi:Na+-transporting methylmalonyl-CoA/oxaloacetate decarboxylase gamma subunit
VGCAREPILEALVPSPRALRALTWLAVLGFGAVFLFLYGALLALLVWCVAHPEEALR